MKNVERSRSIRIYSLGEDTYILVKRFYLKSGRYVRKKVFLHSGQIPFFLRHYDSHGGFYRSGRCAKLRRP